jgi:undecaprenyl phosphate N,N'-diacetylbacillosamine 1-phosphate transferase
MSNQKDLSGNLLPDLKRRTWFGSFLRSTSLDELPSLINILFGEMAIIGPRPLLVEYLPLYNHEQIKRHLVRPGLSGLAQIKGRNILSWKQKFEYDLFYIRKISLLLDIKIMFLTLVKVFNFKNVNYSSKETMPRFEEEK